tara:strand:+ start:298 stop:1065 length:768 start_codon:yes stop_codon:yes gene_type:complete
MNGSDTPDEPPKPSFAPWDDPDYPWDERPMPPAERSQEEDGRVSKNDNRPVVVELVFALKKWEVVAHDGKETFKITGNIEMYWIDDRVIGFPTAHKPMPENMWRPRLTGCAGFDLGKAENYEQLPRFYGFDSAQEHKPSDGRMAQTFPVNLKDGYDISADMERFKSFPFDSTRVDLSIVFFGVKRPEWDKDVRLSLRRPNNASCVKKYASQYQHIDFDGASTHSNDYELAGISLAVGQNTPTARLRTIRGSGTAT